MNHPAPAQVNSWTDRRCENIFSWHRAVATAQVWPSCPCAAASRPPCITASGTRVHFPCAGEEEVAAAGGPSLLKPLVLAMHKGDLDVKTAAATALGRACAVPEVAAAPAQARPEFCPKSPPQQAARPTSSCLKCHLLHRPCHCTYQDVCIRKFDEAFSGLLQKPRWLHVLLRVMGTPSPAAEAAAAAAFAAIATTEATVLAGQPRRNTCLMLSSAFTRLVAAHGRRLVRRVEQLWAAAIW